jgi:cytochrome c biogenesis protein
MAMSSARKTLDFDKEFAQTRDAVGAVLGAQPSDAAENGGTSGASSAGSQDTTR